MGFDNVYSQKLLLELLKFYFSNNMIEIDYSLVDWEELFLEAQYHKVIPFVYEALYKLDVINKCKSDQLNDVLNRMKSKSMQTIFNNSRLIAFQKELMSKFEEASVPVCVLKGTSLMINYPQMMCRALGDIDLYVKPDSFERANNVLLELDFKYENTTTQYHKSYVKNGVEVELHNAVAGLPGGKSGHNLVFLENIYERGLVGQLEYGNNRIPNVCDNGIVQLLHIFHHATERGLKLRLLCDWMMFVDKNLNDDIWNESIFEIYKSANLDYMAKILTKICKDHLGLENENITWCDEIKPNEYRPFLDAVMKKDEIIVRSSSEPEYEHDLRQDVWEYREGLYWVNVLLRNIKLICSGKRTVVQCFEFAKEKRMEQKKIISLNILQKKCVKDYSL